MNLKELNILLKDVALSRKSVNEYNEGDVYQNLNNGEHKYANINFTINSTQVLSNGVVVVNCYLFYIDRLLEDASNKLDIWTVGANTLNQILNAAKNNSGEFFDFSNLTYTNFTEKFADLTAGVYANVDIQILGNISECDEEYVYREGAWDKGYASGFTDGKLVGYESGLTVGYEQGFEDGVSSMGNYLWMQALTDNAALGMVMEDGEGEFNIQYSSDKIHWTEWDFGELDVESGETVYFRGYNASGTGINQGANLRFVTAGIWDCGGDMTSLINGIGGVQDLSNTVYAFKRLLRGTNIISAPNLNIENPGRYQYFETFGSCPYLVNVPEIKYETLRGGVFRYAFDRCTSLVSVTLNIGEISDKDACADMFRGCSSLSSVTSYISSIPQYTTDLPAPTYNWLGGVASAGTFYNLGGFEFDYSEHGIPYEWQEFVITEKRAMRYKGIVFTALEDGCAVGIVNNLNNKPQIQISSDGVNWTDWDYSAVTLNNGEQLAMRATNFKGTSTDKYSKFVISGRTNVQGNLMSLIDNGACTATTIPRMQWFRDLFHGCTTLEISGLTLPATGLTEGCYSNMFDGCSSITKAPELPATTLASHCYHYMFYNCTSLTTVPPLPATTVVSNSMSHVFEGCTALRTSPVLMAKNVEGYGYRGTFINCSNLNKIICFANRILGAGAFYEWVDGVASAGTFVISTDSEILQYPTSAWTIEYSGQTEVSTSAITFASQGTIYVKTDSYNGNTWEITEYPAWCTLSTTQKTADRTPIQITAQENTGPTRSGNIVIVATDRTLITTVTQTGNN